MGETWVVDASPLIALAHANQLDLLHRLTDGLMVPDAVVAEVLAGPDDPARRALAAGWGPRRSATVPQNVSEWSLGKGESEVLALAIEHRATAVLDDRNARRCAKSLGVSVIGTFSIVVRAKRQDLIPSARSTIRAIVDAGLYYDDASIQALLLSVGETWP